MCGEAVAFAQEQQWTLSVVAVHRLQACVGIDVAVERQQVLVTVVIEIDEPTRPAQPYATGRADGVHVGPIDEEAVLLDEQRVGVA